LAGARVSVESAQRKNKCGEKRKLEGFELILGGEASYRCRGRQRESWRDDGDVGDTELLPHREVDDDSVLFEAVWAGWSGSYWAGVTGPGQ
jgi:hypothetical protein